MNDSVVAIVSAFFIIGITVGIIAVIALSVLRTRRPADPGDQDDLPENGPRGTVGQRANPGWEAHPGWDDAAPQDKPHWPGDDDNDFSR
jgi:hypothetical protein